MPGLLEPVVGSRTPLPQAQGGGPMDRDALIRALLLRQMQMQQPQQNLGIGAPNFLNPRAVMDARQRAAGVY